jgi:hypothetical protein
MKNKNCASIILYLRHLLPTGKHYTFAVGNLGWHIIADESQLIYIMICKKDYPQVKRNEY